MEECLLGMCEALGYCPGTKKNLLKWVRNKHKEDMALLNG